MRTSRHAAFICLALDEPDGPVDVAPLRHPLIGRRYWLDGADGLVNEVEVVAATGGHVVLEKWGRRFLLPLKLFNELLRE